MIDRINELKAALAIDINNLDVACQEQPQHVTEIEDILADLKCDVRKSEMDYDIACSVADQQIRDNPSMFGIAKVTESAVKAAVVTHGDVKNALEKVISAKHLMDKASAVVTGYHHRRAMLDDEIKGAISGLFGDIPDSYNSTEENGFTRRGRQ